MKSSLAALSFLGSILSLALVPGPAASGKALAATALMVSPMQDLLEILDEDQRKQIQFSFEDAERHDWHFVPRSRKGLPLKAMSAPQREAVMNLLRAALSEQGAAKVRDILVLEGVLQEIEAGRPGFRDPEMFFLTLFGEPSGGEPWGWRFEGHHLSLNFSSISGLVAGTPAFYGANPAEVPEGLGERSGLRALADEEDLGRKLVNALDGDQKSRAVVSAQAPREIITGADREVSLEAPAGLPFSEMTPEQQEILRQIVSAYVDNLDAAIAADYWERIEKKGWGEVHFAWAGGTEKGEGHYYRVQGPTLLIEYDNVQNNASHVHSVLRDLENDWGADHLRRHYEQRDHR